MQFYMFGVYVVKLLSVSFAELNLLWHCFLLISSGGTSLEISAKSESKRIPMPVNELLLLRRIERTNTLTSEYYHSL